MQSPSTRPSISCIASWASIPRALELNRFFHLDAISRYVRGQSSNVDNAFRTA